jgi:hypothetical protein
MSAPSWNSGIGPLAEVLHAFVGDRCRRFSRQKPLAEALGPFEAYRGSFEEPLRARPAPRTSAATAGRGEVGSCLQWNAIDAFDAHVPERNPDTQGRASLNSKRHDFDARSGG